MQAEIRLISDPLMMDHLMFPQVSEKVQTWIQNQVYAPINHLVGIGAQMYDYTKKAYDNLNNAVRLSNIKAALKGMDTNAEINPNEVLNIIDSAKLCTANFITQRYIMAQPDLRSLYHKQRVDGFSESYHDQQPGVVGENHYDYCRVMSGVVVEKEDGSSEYKEYYQADLYDEGPLQALDKACIVSMWDLVLLTVQGGGDPTMYR